MCFLRIFAKKGVAKKISFPYIARLAEGNLSGRQAFWEGLLFWKKVLLIFIAV